MLSLILTALMGLAGCRTIDRTLQEAHIPCGHYRWPVKVLADPDAEAVRFEPIGTTVREAIAFSRPADLDRKHRNGNEFYVYRLTARVLEVHPRLDQDLHLFLSDPDDPEIRMIAEIPNPKCTTRSPHEPDFDAARRVADPFDPAAARRWSKSSASASSTSSTNRREARPTASSCIRS